MPIGPEGYAYLEVAPVSASGIVLFGDLGKLVPMGRQRIEAIDNTNIVIRQTLLRNQSVRTERFRVRRWKELGGRKRFALLECELETYES